MQSKWWTIILPAVYVAWACYMLDIPDMPNLHAADVGFLSLWALRSCNFIGGVFFVALVRFCSHLHLWFFSPEFQQLGTGGFIALIGTIIPIGILQWWGIGLL